MNSETSDSITSMNSMNGPSATTGLYTYTYTHSSTPLLPPDFTPADGSCSGCHRADGAAGDILDAHKQDEDRKAIENGSLFTYKILSVDNAVALFLLLIHLFTITLRVLRKVDELAIRMIISALPAAIPTYFAAIKLSRSIRLVTMTNFFSPNNSFSLGKNLEEITEKPAPVANSQPVPRASNPYSLACDAPKMLPATMYPAPITAS
jgi:hypothetical protein